VAVDHEINTEQLKGRNGVVDRQLGPHECEHLVRCERLRSPRPGVRRTARCTCVIAE
jgi:hypothetical protein